VKLLIGGGLLILSGDDTSTVKAFMNLAIKVEDYVKRIDMSNQV